MPALHLLRAALFIAGACASLSAQGAGEERKAAPYRISRGDRVSVSVLGEPELKVTGARVEPVGTVNLVLVKEVRLAGLTILEAEAAVAKAYQDGRFLRSPRVTITVEEYAPRTVIVSGKPPVIKSIVGTDAPDQLYGTDGNDVLVGYTPGYFGQYVQDGVVPRTQIAPTLRFIMNLAAQYDLTISNIFHAGDGNLHPNFLFDSHRPGDLEKVGHISAQLMRRVIEAGGTRLRPILMTSVAIVAGMLPVALGSGEGGDFRAPLGRAVIGGVITSTLLTLLVIPTFYDMLSSWRAAFLRRVLGWGRAPQPAAPERVAPG